MMVSIPESPIRGSIKVDIMGSIIFEKTILPNLHATKLKCTTTQCINHLEPKYFSIPAGSGIFALRIYDHSYLWINLVGHIQTR